MGHNIRRLRLERGWTQQELADRAGVSSVAMLESGKRSIPRMENLESIAEALGVSVGELFDADRAMRTVPLVGYVGAGEMYYPEPEFGPWVGFDEVEAPRDARADTVAVKVRGASMEPAYSDGDTVFFRKPTGFDPEVCIGRDCVIQIPNGPAYIKRLKRRPDGQYLLESNAADSKPIVVERIEWAAAVDWVKKN